MSEELSAKTCVPCRGGIPPLTKAEAEGYLAQVPKWTLQDDGKRIERSFSFDNFQQALDFQLALTNPPSQLFVQDSLVQGVLIDDQHAVGRLHHQVRVVNLQRRPRRKRR